MSLRAMLSLTALSLVANVATADQTGHSSQSATFLHDGRDPLAADSIFNSALRTEILNAINTFRTFEDCTETDTQNGTVKISWEKIKNVSEAEVCLFRVALTTNGPEEFLEFLITNGFSDPYMSKIPSYTMETYGIDEGGWHLLAHFRRESGYPFSASLIESGNGNLSYLATASAKISDSGIVIDTQFSFSSN